MNLGYFASNATSTQIWYQALNRGPRVCPRSPQLKPAFDGLEKMGDYKLVIYTMRATFLLYRSGFRPSVIPLRWNASWHEGGQVYFPSSVKTADDILDTYCTPIELMEEEKVKTDNPCYDCIFGQESDAGDFLTLLASRRST